jgi:alpha-1,2-mannosyltransferase
VRILGGPDQVGSWYLLIPLLLGVVGLTVAAVLARRGDWLGAVALTGTTGLLVSPISWTHHWVWILPALVVLMRGGMGSRVAAALAYVLFVLAPMWWTPHPGGPGEPGFHGLATVAANCFLIAGLAFLAYMTFIVCRAGALTRPRLMRRVVQVADHECILEPALVSHQGLPGQRTSLGVVGQGLGRRSDRAL